jgi:hypothetical protein
VIPPYPLDGPQGSKALIDTYGTVGTGHRLTNKIGDRAALLARQCPEALVKVVVDVELCANHHDVYTP